MASDEYAPDYTVYRKSADQADWGEGVRLAPRQTTYVDENVAEGVRYEYQIVRQFRHPRMPSFNHDGYGYILTGINVPVVDHRGRVILVVEDRVADALADKVARLRTDLIGDGWTVTQLNVAAGDAPTQVRQRIRDVYFSTESHADVVFLLGHVPVAHSGYTAPDGHEKRALPTDALYGDVDGDWVDTNNDGVFENNQIASDLEMAVGRVDFSDLNEIGVELNDLELTARYLDKDHAFRHAAWRPARRGLIGDRIGDDRGRAPAAAGYRAFAALYGPENIVQANVEDGGTDDQRWFPRLQAETFGWAFGSGAGSFASAAFLGTRGQYHAVESTDLASGAKAAFYLLFGSYFVDWAQPNNLLRSALASPEGGLGAAWSGRPSYFFHRMGLGETIGDGVRLSQNNDGFYFSPANASRRGVHINWLGDPTLRLDYPAPPKNLTGTREGDAVRLSWEPSNDAANEPVRYLVFRAPSTEGEFVRVTAEPIADTTFTDAASRGGGTYLVRAVKLQETASGTYQNASEGILWSPDGPTTASLATPEIESPPSSAPPPPAATPAPEPAPVSGPTPSAPQNEPPPTPTSSPAPATPEPPATAPQSPPSGAENPPADIMWFRGRLPLL